MKRSHTQKIIIIIILRFHPKKASLEHPFPASCWIWGRCRPISIRLRRGSAVAAATRMRQRRLMEELLRLGRKLMVLGQKCPSSGEFGRISIYFTLFSFDFLGFGPFWAMVSRSGR